MFVIFVVSFNLVANEIHSCMKIKKEQKEQKKNQEKNLLKFEKFFIFLHKELVG